MERSIEKGYKEKVRLSLNGIGYRDPTKGMWEKKSRSEWFPSLGISVAG